MRLDDLSDGQLKMLFVGGNRRFKEIMLRYDLNDYSTKYFTKASQFYRNILKDTSMVKQENNPDELKKLFQNLPLVEGKEIIKDYENLEK
jgi:hypothetical protein